MIHIKNNILNFMHFLYFNLIVRCFEDCMEFPFINLGIVFIESIQQFRCGGDGVGGGGCEEREEK